MKQSYLKLLNDYLLQAIGIISAIDFFEDVNADIELQKSGSVQPIYDELKKQMDDKEYRSKLSPPELQTLGKNLINYQSLLREMDDALTTLMRKKWSNNIQGALWMLEDARVFIAYLLTTTDEDGAIIKAKDLGNTKKFQKMNYIGKLAHAQTMLSIITDIVNEGDIGQLPGFTIKTAIGKTSVYLQQEIEDREANGSPELYKFDIPKIEVPELPESAPDEPTEHEPAKAEQLEIPLEVE